ncbi:MAG: hypothetical protein ACLFVP_01945 [Candidatus Bathyarchaeia archaeon]
MIILNFKIERRADNGKSETSLIIKLDADENLSADLKIRIPEEKMKDYSSLFEDLSILLSNLKELTEKDIANLEKILGRSI